MWDFTAPDLDDLVYWANIIDGAQYPDPRTAVELGAPAMKLTLVIEGSKGSDTVQQIIRYMQRMPLDGDCGAAGYSGALSAALSAASEFASRLFGRRPTNRAA